MNVLIISATELEVKPILKAKRKTTGFDTLVTGIGCVACAWSLMKQLHKKKYDLLIQAGIGGSFNSALHLGNVVVIQNDNFGDLGVAENNGFQNIFDMGLSAPNKMPYTKGQLANTHNAILKKSALPVVDATTVNRITTNKNEIALLKKHFNPAIETMEGAAFHYVAIMEKIPFIQFRSISNYVGERNKKKWFLNEAVENLNRAILQSSFLDV